MTMGPTVSVVICTRLRPLELGNCLRAIAALKRQPDELIIVDNSDGNEQTAQLAQDSSATYLVEPITGLSRARNRGLSESKSEIVAYLDDDAVPDENWLGQILEPFSDPRVAVVTGKVITSETENCDKEGTQSLCLDNQHSQWFEIAVFGGLGGGGNMALRKSACKIPLMFDERLGRGAPYRGAEEHVAFARLLSQNHSAVNTSTAIVSHFSPNPMVVPRDARNAVAYVLLLFAEFPRHRLDLLRFLIRRVRRKPLNWTRDAPDPGELLRSNWVVLLKASFSGVLLYLRTKKAD